jgi:predicted metal-dependent phosphoesterase TrpH
MSFSVDLHTHTRVGSNCSYMEPQQLARRARELGLDGVCITEHNAPWDAASIAALNSPDGPTFFAGSEVSTELGDVLVYSVDGLAGGGLRAADLRSLVDEAGGVMVAAHPFRRYFVPGATPDPEEARRNPLFALVDAIEVFNGMGSRPEMEFASEVVRRSGLPGVGGSDSHAPHTVGQCYTDFERPVRSTEELVAELKAGRFRAVHPLMGLVFEQARAGASRGADHA